MDFLDYGDDEQLEKDYTALKSKENEEQIELRRLRTENRLLRQRIENLEKVEAKLLRQHEESASLADKLIQDQVTRAQEAEDCYALKNELSVTRQQLVEMQKKLEEAEDIIGDIKRRTSIIQGAATLDEAEGKNLVQHLQEELISVRLREAETVTYTKGLKTKIKELEDTNLRLQRAPSNDVQHLQEELIAVKLREAEANLSLKELRQKVKEIEAYWEAHMERMASTHSPKEKASKAEIRHLQEDVMTVKLREAKAVADLKETKQKVMELETQTQICQNQIRRMDEENKMLKQHLAEAAERERELQSRIKDMGRKLDDEETKRKEEAMMARIKEAENVQLIAELRQQIAEVEIEREELLTVGQLQETHEKDDLENQLFDLQDEMMQLKMSTSPRNSNARNVMTSSFLTTHDSDEEWDTEVRDSENLDRTLSDIIEGRSPMSTPSKPIPRFDSLDGSGDHGCLSLKDMGNNLITTTDASLNNGASSEHSETPIRKEFNKALEDEYSLNSIHSNESSHTDANSDSANNVSKQNCDSNTHLISQQRLEPTMPSLTAHLQGNSHDQSVKSICDENSNNSLPVMQASGNECFSNGHFSSSASISMETSDSAK